MGRPRRHFHAPLDLLGLEVVDDHLVVAGVARPVEHVEVAPVGTEVQVVRVAADLHALEELLRFGVDDSEVVALVVDDPRGLAVGMEHDAIRLAGAELDRARYLEGGRVDDRHGVALGVRDVQARRRGGDGRGDDRDEHEHADGGRHTGLLRAPSRSR